MKKIFALIAAVAIALSLTACGDGADKQPLIDAFNAASSVYDEMAGVINDNIEHIDEASRASIKEIGDQMTEYKALVESTAKMSKEEVEAAVAELKELPLVLSELKAAVEILIGGNQGASAATEEQIATLTEKVNAITPIYNQAVALGQKNGWNADETTVDELTSIGDFLTQMGAAIEDPSLFADDAAYADAMAEFETLATLLDEIAIRVATPLAS